MGSRHPKIVENAHYHVWTDALHARALANQARNKWDRGTYVRWAVTTSWTVLEIACQRALEKDSISYSFRKNLDSAIRCKSLPPLDWGTGLWQKVTQIQETRKNYVHRFLKERDLFPDAAVADRAITVIRDAVLSIYKHVKRIPPTWIHDDEDRGWDKGRTSSANATIIRAGACIDNSKAIRICFIRDNKEHIHEILPPGTNPEPYLEDLILHVKVPISAVKAYEGDKLISERSVRMRGGGSVRGLTLSATS